MSNAKKWFIGCSLAALITFVIFIVGVIALVIYGKNQVDAMYSDTPRYEPYKVTALDKDNLEFKIKSVEEQLKRSSDPQVLSLTASEINTFIERENKSESVYRVRMEGRVLEVDMSLDNDGKFINVSGELSIRTVDGEIVVKLLGAKVGNMNLPKQMRDDINRNNLTESFFNKEEAPVEFIEAYIDDSKLWLKYKAKESAN